MVCCIPWVRDPLLELFVRQEAVGVDREVTNGREPLMSTGCLGQFSELAGHNVSERRASLENVNRESRPSTRKGKAAAGEAENKTGFVGLTGVMTMARDKGNSRQSREIRGGGRLTVNRQLARVRPGHCGSRRGS